MSNEKTDLIYDALIDFRDECRKEFSSIKLNAKEHTIEMRNHKDNTAAEFKDLDKRLHRVEAPTRALGIIKSWALWVVAIAAAIGHLKGLI